MRIRASDNRAGVLGFHVVHVSGRSGCRVQVKRRRKWRILDQLAEVVWEEIPSARVGLFKSPALLRREAGEIQMARSETLFRTPADYETLT